MYVQKKHEQTAFIIIRRYTSTRASLHCGELVREKRCSTWTTEMNKKNLRLRSKQNVCDDKLKIFTVLYE